MLALSVSFEPLGSPKRVGLGDSCNSPVWTPDGRRLVMEVGFPDSPPGLWSARPDGSDAKPLHLTGSHLTPALGRGGRLAYRRDLTRSAIRRLDLESGQSVALIESSGRDWDPVYSPDGLRILFRSDRGPNGIWIAEAVGSNASLLVKGGADGRWSPDGSRIAYRALAPGNTVNSGPHDIWIVSAAGGPSNNLTNSPSRDVAPTWSRDGNWIFFTSNRGGRNQLWKMPADGGEAQLVLDEFFSDAHESIYGPDLYVTSGRTLIRASVDGKREVLIERVGGLGRIRCRCRGAVLRDYRSRLRVGDSLSPIR